MAARPSIYRGVNSPGVPTLFRRDPDIVVVLTMDTVLNMDNVLDMDTLEESAGLVTTLDGVLNIDRVVNMNTLQES